MLRQASWMKGVNYATLGQLAYNMIFSSLPAKSIVVRAGDAVDLIYLVARGFVTMYPAYPSLSYPHKNREVANYAQRGRSCHTNLKLAVSMRGRGCLIGEREFRGGAVVYEHTYETAEETDLFVLPKRALEVYNWYSCIYFKSRFKLFRRNFSLGCAYSGEPFVAHE